MQIGSLAIHRSREGSVIVGPVIGKGVWHTFPKGVPTITPTLRVRGCAKCPDPRDIGDGCVICSRVMPANEARQLTPEERTLLAGCGGVPERLNLVATHLGFTSSPSSVGEDRRISP